MAIQAAVKNKLSTAELSALYDRIYDIADRLFKKHNPCNIHSVDGVICCMGRKDKKHNKLMQQKYKEFLCCGGCKGMSTDGCVIKCLPCKLFLCGWLLEKRKHKTLARKLKRLKQIANNYHILTQEYYQTKNEVLRRSKKRDKAHWNYWKELKW